MAEACVHKAELSIYNISLLIIVCFSHPSLPPQAWLSYLESCWYLPGIDSTAFTSWQLSISLR